MPLRDDFPEAGQEFQGARTDDGWELRIVFAGSTLEASFAMLRAFLQEEGYGDVPLPADAKALRLFKRPKSAQIRLFEERGYVHNPVKILFPQASARSARTALELRVFNEKAPSHLLRFHGVLNEKQAAVFEEKKAVEAAETAKNRRARIPTEE